MSMTTAGTCSGACARVSGHFCGSGLCGPKCLHSVRAQRMAATQRLRRTDMEVVTQRMCRFHLRLRLAVMRSLLRCRDELRCAFGQAAHWVKHEVELCDADVSGTISADSEFGKSPAAQCESCSGPNRPPRARVSQGVRIRVAGWQTYRSARPSATLHFLRALRRQLVCVRTAATARPRFQQTAASVLCPQHLDEATQLVRVRERETFAGAHLTSGCASRALAASDKLCDV